MNVFVDILLTRATELSPDVFSIEESNVDDGGRDTNVEVDIGSSK
jgi:hypothetical protein